MESAEVKILEAKNPWLGLQSYPENETLYGRDNDIQELTQCVLGDKETLLYGKSGIGKSSILNAGVIPTSIRKGYLPVPVRLDHKKEESYLSQIRTEIAFQMAKRYGDTNAQGIVEVLKPKREGEESIYEYFHRHKFVHPTGERIKLLIIIDQFEEIFTLQDKESIKKKFFAELADFLNDIMPEYLREEEEFVEPNTPKTLNLNGENDLDDIFGDVQLSYDRHAPKFITDNDVHFVFTIREDFLSEFEYYTATIPALKHNRYGLRPLNEEQAAQIILRPVPGLVSKSVAKLIIGKVTDKKDFDIDGVPGLEVDSAVLSLYMNRLYEAKTGDEITEELVEEKGSGIIKQFYYSVIEKMDPQKVEFLEERLLNSQNRRENVTEYEVLHHGHFTEEELNELCEGDKKILRKFYLSGDMRIEYIHDILCPVIKEHKEDRQKQKEEEAERKRIEEEKQRFIAAEQEKREKIEREAQLERERLKDETRQIRLKNRKRFTLFGVLVGCILLFLAMWFFGWKIPYSQNYVNFTLVHGWPQGIGKPVGIQLSSGIGTKLDLSKAEENNFTVLYRLTRHGVLPTRWTGHHFNKVEIITPNGAFVTNIFKEELVVGLMESELSDNRARAFAQLQKKTASWKYFPNMCVAHDINGNGLYSIQYYKDNTLISADSTKYTQWAVFYDANGKPMIVSDNGTDRMRQTVKNGIVTGCMFFTAFGVPQKNAYGTYGYAFEIDSMTNLCSKRYDVNKFGDRINDSAIDLYYDEYGRVNCSSQFIVSYPQKGMRVYQFEHFSDTLLFNANGTISYGTFHTPGGLYSLIAFEYDEKNRPLMNKKYTGTDLVECTEYTYNAESDKCSCIKHYANGESFMEYFLYPDSCSEESFLWKDGKKCNIAREVNEYGDRITYHRCRKTTQIDSIYLYITLEYFNADDQPVCNDREYAKRTIKIDRGIQKPILEYCYLANGNIYKSTLYEYDEYGRQTSQAVAGIEGTPVRYPDWDWDGMCYYKASLLMDNTNQIYVAMDGYDEFGDQAYIMQKNIAFSNTPMSLQQVTQENQTNEDASEFDIGLRLAQSKKTPINSANVVKVAFLHLLNKTGNIFTAIPSLVEDSLSLHPKDGDVLFHIGQWHIYQSQDLLQKEWRNLSKQGGTIEILRAEGMSYKKHSFKIFPGLLGADYCVMPITESHQQRINNIQL